MFSFTLKCKWVLTLSCEQVKKVRERGWGQKDFQGVENENGCVGEREKKQGLEKKARYERMGYASALAARFRS